MCIGRYTLVIYNNNDFQDLSGKWRDSMCCMSYGWKRDKRTVLSSNKIFCEYITVILAFCNLFFFCLLFLFFLGGCLLFLFLFCFFACICLHFLFFRVFSYNHRETSDEHWTTNKAEIFGPVEEIKYIYDFFISPLQAPVWNWNQSCYFSDTSPIFKDVINEEYVGF